MMTVLRETWSGRERPKKLHCLTDQTLRWQRRLEVRFFVYFRFSALANIRTRGVQARVRIGGPDGQARTISPGFMRQSEVYPNLPDLRPFGMEADRVARAWEK